MLNRLEHRKLEEREFRILQGVLKCNYGHMEHDKKMKKMFDQKKKLLKLKTLNKNKTDSD